MPRKTFHQRIRNNKSKKVKKRPCDKVGYRKEYHTIKKLVKLDVHHLWWMYREAKYIDLTCDAVQLLDAEMKKQDFEKWMQYHENLRKTKYRKELLRRVAKANKISSSKVRISS